MEQWSKLDMSFHEILGGEERDSQLTDHDHPKLKLGKTPPLITNHQATGVWKD